MHYELCPHVGAGTVRFALEGDRLDITRQKSGVTENVGLRNVTRLNLRQELPGAWSLHVHRAGGRPIVIPSRHFVGAGDFEPRNQEYRAFVGALHSAVVAANPKAAFVGGSSGLYWFGWLCIVFGSLMLAGIAAAFATETPPRMRVLAIPPLMGGLGWAFQRQGRAQAYDPGAPPAELLPPMA
jgi:hypothetical protein